MRTSLRRTSSDHSIDAARCASTPATDMDRLPVAGARDAGKKLHVAAAIDRRDRRPEKREESISQDVQAYIIGQITYGCG